MVSGRLSGRWGLVLVAAVLVVALVAPHPAVPLGAARLAALTLAVAGASLLVVRAGVADLATAAAVAAGAYLGGVVPALMGLPVLLALPAAALGGALVGAASGALHGRVGRVLGALTSLALGTGVVAALGGWTDAGGVAGFHAVPLPVPGGIRVELFAVAVVVVALLAVAGRFATSPWAAAAAVAVRAPAHAASLGRRPAVDAAVLGAMAGALLGAGGSLLAAVDGSVVPAAYGLQLAAALALAALVGGVPPLGPAVGTAVVWGPSTLWPLAPVVGTAPVLLAMGPVGLVLLGLRRGRPLITGRERLGPSRPAPPAGDGTQLPDDGPEPAPRPPDRRVELRVRGASSPTAPVDLDVAPGEVVALAGPNGAGKSTLLARIGGQLPDEGSVRLDGAELPRGAVARARLGVRRTWQRPPSVDPADVAAVTIDGPVAAVAARWAAATLRLSEAATASSLPTTGDHARGVADLVHLAAAGPGLALLDEPTDVDALALLAYLRGLAAAGTAVLVVDHRPEVLAGADRVVRVGVEAPEVAQ